MSPNIETNLLGLTPSISNRLLALISFCGDQNFKSRILPTCQMFVSNIYSKSQMKDFHTIFVQHRFSFSFDTFLRVVSDPVHTNAHPHSDSQTGTKIFESARNQLSVDHGPHMHAQMYKHALRNAY